MKEPIRISPQNVTIEGSAIGSSREKRFYLSGVVLKATCPHCKQPLERDFGGRYLDYPVYGEPVDLTLYCQQCERDDIVVKVQLNCSLTVISE